MEADILHCGNLQSQNVISVQVLPTGDFDGNPTRKRGRS